MFLVKGKSCSFVVFNFFPYRFCSFVSINICHHPEGSIVTMFNKYFRYICVFRQFIIQIEKNSVKSSGGYSIPYCYLIFL